uniref:Uncharacterized protein n=1 Tax=Lepeophtheirus salmonis TaxID=72036 RepID=A0A0K2V264_LEPSM
MVRGNKGKLSMWKKWLDSFELIFQERNVRKNVYVAKVARFIETDITKPITNIYSIYLYVYVYR